MCTFQYSSKNTNFLTSTCTLYICMYMYVRRLPYRTRAANIHGQMEKYVSFWDYVDELHKDCAIFYNMKYLPSNETVVKL